MAEDLECLIKNHIEEETKLIDLHHRAIFGDKALGVIGMNDKVDTMYEILTNYKGAKKIFGEGLMSMRTLIVIGGIIAIWKGWLVALVHYLVKQ